MKTYWFSFSFQGKNNGVCIVEADSEIEGIVKLVNSNLIPEYDDVLGYELNDMSEEASLEYNRLYTSEEMIAFGYGVIITKN